MSTKLYLKHYRSLEFQPVWWQNFIRHIDIKYNRPYIRPPDNSSNTRSTVIEEELNSFGGIRVRNDSELFIEFENPCHSTMFLLRFG